MSTKEIVTSMLDVLSEEQLNGLMVFIESFLTPSERLSAAIEESEKMLSSPDTQKYSLEEALKELKS